MKSVLRDVVETLVLTALIFVMVRAVVQNFRVDGRSMEPTLQSGQYLIINKAVYWRLDGPVFQWLFPGIEDRESVYLFAKPRRGEIVVFHFPSDPSRDFIKRVIAVPGDTVEVKQGRVFLNGKPLHEAYIADQPHYTWGPAVVPPGHYFVLGDNRNNSSDSHVWGLVPEENIIGKAWLSYWPIEHLGILPNSSALAIQDSR